MHEKNILWKKKYTQVHSVNKDIQTSAFGPNQHLSNKGIK